MRKLISCDWGTSALRLRVIETDPVSVLAEAVSTGGISVTFGLWKQSGKPGNERLAFYQSVLAVQILELEAQLKSSLAGTPLIISGMASSNIGMMELPYNEVPFSTDGSGLHIKIIEATGHFPHQALMVPGVRTADDAMRGEETQLIGCVNKNDKGDRVFIFPGTHSKHVRVKDGLVTDIKTYMTGEFFELLSKKSILSGSVEEGGGLGSNKNEESFAKGVRASAQSSLLHNVFLARTNGLFAKLTREENYYWLSGLLIGTELRDLGGINNNITLVTNEELKPYYLTALKIAGKHEGSFEVENADMALMKGQVKIWNSLDK